MRLHEDVMRVLTVKVEAHEEAPRRWSRPAASATTASDRGDRDRDRDRGPRRPRREDEN